jgi:hypothetical protein
MANSTIHQIVDFDFFLLMFSNLILIQFLFRKTICVNF